MFLYEFFVWLSDTALGQYLNQSTAAFASTESLHIVALSLVVGAALITHLFALGIALKTVDAPEVARNLQPVILGGLIVVAISGALLVAAGPFKYYTNPLFPLKLGLLAAALLAQWQLGRRLRRDGVVSKSTRALALASLLLWTAVVITGRWLGLI